MGQIKFIATICTLLLLAACGGGSGSSNGGWTTGSVTTNTRINAFKITGSSMPTGTSIPINAATNGGEFTIDWDVTATDPYTFKLFLSADSTLDITTDIEILTLNCGSESLVFSCNDIGNFICHFDSSNLMGCGVSSPGNRPKDLTAFLNTIPMTAFLVIRACDTLENDCKTNALEVELQ